MLVSIALGICSMRTYNPLIISDTPNLQDRNKNESKKIVQESAQRKISYTVSLFKWFFFTGYLMMHLSGALYWLEISIGNNCTEGIRSRITQQARDALENRSPLLPWESSDNFGLREAFNALEVLDDQLSSAVGCAVSPRCYCFLVKHPVTEADDEDTPGLENTYHLGKHLEK